MTEGDIQGSAGANAPSLYGESRDPSRKVCRDFTAQTSAPFRAGQAKGPARPKSYGPLLELALELPGQIDKTTC